MLIALLIVSLFVIAFLLWFVIDLQQKVKAQNRSLLASRQIYQIILEDLDYHTMIQKVADSIPDELGFVTGVLSLVDDTSRTIRRVTASHTKAAEEAIKALTVPFDKIEISVDDPSNLMAKAVRDRKSYMTDDIYDVLGPVVNKTESAKIQKIMSTKTTLIYPISFRNKVIGVFIASTTKPPTKISFYDHDILDNFVNLVGITLQNSLLFTSLKEAKENLTVTNRQINTMNIRLNELDKLKDDFVSVASHELRTPMTAIRSYAWMALHRSDIPPSPKLTRYLERILISTERLINLVNDMLNVSRIESGRVEIIPQVFDLTQLVDDVLTEVGPKAAEKSLHLKTVHTNLPKVYADPEKVHQILLNLIGNALKFTPHDGTVTVSFLADGQFVEVSVADTGVGISREDQSRLFQKFGRLDNSYVAAATSGGTGLGLYICKSLVEMMKGRIWAKSNGLGKGTTFSFTVPTASKSVLANADNYSHRADGETKVLEPVAI